MKTEAGKAESPSQLIDARIEELDDWRGTMLSRIRALIKQAVPDVVEEWKWRGVPVWYHDGMLCTGETYKSVVKVTFAKGASLEDPADCSTRASKAMSGARSMFVSTISSTRAPSRPTSGPRPR
jgi:hypothetical protein